MTKILTGGLTRIPNILYLLWLILKKGLWWAGLLAWGCSVPSLALRRFYFLQCAGLYHTQLAVGSAGH